MRIAVRVGYIGAIALGIFGAVIEEWLLVGIALFGGISCYLTHKQMEYTETLMNPGDEGWIPGLDDAVEEDQEDKRPSTADRAS